jgi:protein-L-isoaspartate(D-aspartate) O-methyltransferase
MAGALQPFGCEDRLPPPPRIWQKDGQMPQPGHAKMNAYATRRVMMVDTQVRPSDVTKYPIIDAMLAVPREAFVPEALREAAYVGENLALGHGRALLEPRTFAKFLEALEITPDDRVLDIGAAGGYAAAVLGRMAGTVLAVEEDGALADQTEAALAAYGAANISLKRGNLASGMPGPFDVILIEGAVQVMPAAVLDMLAEGGRIAALFQVGVLGTARLGRKERGQVHWRDLFNTTAPILPGYAKEAGFSF